MVLLLLREAATVTQDRGGLAAPGARCVPLPLRPGSGAASSSVPFLLDRVQKEQLAAIFKLLEDNKETFGEMSDGDVQEQLRLYDM